MARPHVLWVEVGFGIAIAAFAAIIVVGQQTSTSTYVGMLSVFLAVFIAFTVAAEGAAHRAEKRVGAEQTSRRRGATPGGRRAPTGV
jgi:F0F1-type ATP synthase assembly protein I